MFYIFILIYIVSLSYILFKKRAVDLYLILFGGLFYYSIPLFIDGGKLTFPGVVLSQNINSLTYIVYSFAFIVSFFFMHRNDNQKKRPIKYERYGRLDKLTSKRIFFLTLLIFFIFAFGVYQFGIFDYLTTNKQVNEEDMTLIPISIVLSMIMLPVSFYYRKLFSFSIYFLILFSFFLYGVRSYFVVGIISSGFIYFRFKEIRLVKKLPLFILAFLFAISMAVYKFIYVHVKDSSFNELFSIIKELDFDLLITHLIADPLAVIYNLNYTIENNIILSINYLFHRILSIIPQGGTFFSFLTGESYPRYSTILNNEYTNIHWGLASSMYAELIAISGFLGFGVIYILMNTIISYFNSNIKLSGLNFYNLIFISSFTYFLFYSHRLDITFVLGVFKFSILIWIFFKYIFVKKLKR